MPPLTNCALIVEKVTESLLVPQHRPNGGIDHLRGIELGDPKYCKPGHIDLLMCSDVYGDILSGGFIPRRNNRSHFGCVFQF